jgi:asparagine N-glycosylation enzyme membrane subunit Stt3
MEAFFKFLEVLVICIAGLVALFLILMALPNSSFRDVVLSLGKRVGVTAAAVAMVPPMDMIPVGGELYDLAAVIVVCFYWYSFFKEQQDKLVKPQNTIVIPSVSQGITPHDKN